MNTHHQTLEQFEQNKQRNITLLKRLLEFVNQGIKLGVNLDKAYIDKIENAITEQAHQKLKIALVGGFSEGKTSIIAAWLEKLQGSMKIDAQESSDSIAIYNIDDELEIIDTPGLFGFKEDENQKKYKSKTEEFISQAHIVLYVMDSSNPIKQSHTEELHWLFRELDLLPRTIFICNKFDENADLEDEEEYQEKYEEVKQNIIKGLKNSINLEYEEEKSLSIVAIAANPYGKGIENWLKEPERFRELSHIKSLQNATTRTIEKIGKDSIILQSQQSIASDILLKQMPVACAEFDFYTKESKNLEKLLEDIEKKIESLEKNLLQSRTNLKDWVKEYFSGLVLQANGLSMETANEFIIREIGEEGINININVQNQFERELGALNTQIERVASQFEAKMQEFDDSMVKELAKQGLTKLKMSGVINASSVKLARDGIVTLGNSIGLDIGQYLKFKPWQAVKLANAANVGLAAAQIALELWDSHKKAEQEEEFRKGIKEIVENFNKQKAELIEYLDSEEFKQNVPLFQALKQEKEKLENELKHINESKEARQKWKAEGEIIEAEFREIKQIELNPSK